MHLFKYKDDGPYYYRFRLNGKLYVRTSKTKNKQLAERIGYQFRDQLIADAAHLGRAGLISINDGLAQYAETKRGLASYRTLKSHIDFIVNHTPKDLAFDKLTVAHVEKILLARREQSAPATAKHTINCLRAAHTYVKRLGYTVHNIEWPSVTIRNQRQRYLTPEEEQQFLDELSPERTWSKMASDLTDYQKEGLQQNHDIGIALLDTGGRLNEVLRLQWKDVDVKGKTIVLWRTKTRNGTTLMMTERLHQVMKRRFDNKRDATWVFPGISGPAISSGARIRKAIKRAGLSDFRLHDIRHSFASKLVQQRCTLYEVAALLGHSSPNTSARYSHLEKKSVAEKAANVLNDLNKR